MSWPKPGRLVPAVGHLADDQDVVVDPHTARLDLAGGAVSRGTRHGLQAEAASPYGVSLASRMPSSSVSKGEHHQDRAEDLGLDDLAVLRGVGDEGGR